MGPDGGEPLLRTALIHPNQRFDGKALKSFLNLGAYGISLRHPPHSEILEQHSKLIGHRHSIAYRWVALRTGELEFRSLAAAGFARGRAVGYGALQFIFHNAVGVRAADHSYIP